MSDVDSIKNDLKTSVNRLRLCYLGFLFPVIVALVIIGLPWRQALFSDNLFCTLFTLCLGLFPLVCLVSVLFRIRFVLQRIGEAEKAWLWQLGVVVIPVLGALVIPLIIIHKGRFCQG